MVKESIMFRAINIFVELALLMIVVYSLLAAVKIAIFDLGLDQKYRKFIESVLMIFNCLMFVFLAKSLFDPESFQDPPQRVIIVGILGP